MLSLGVVIPTKNSVAHLPMHLEAMAAWLDLAAEVVVVDSFSTDGTVDFLKANLRQANVRFFSHPPGLYASWNHGIAQLSTDYIYLSTVGDTMSRAGLQLLLKTAESLRCDVVLSKPTFRNSAGQSLPDIDWPIDEIIQTLAIKEPRRLSKLEAVLFAITNLTAALTGSCASDLFRTSLLQRYPFPCDFGTIGDGPWGIRHAATIVWAVIPERFSTFLKHDTNASPDEWADYERAPRLDQVAREAMAQARSNGTLSSSEWERLQPDILLEAVTDYLDAKAEFDRQRKDGRAWVFYPQSWLARRRRTRALANLQVLKTRTLKAIRMADG